MKQLNNYEGHLDNELKKQIYYKAIKAQSAYNRDSIIRTTNFGDLTLKKRYKYLSLSFSQFWPDSLWRA